VRNSHVNGQETQKLIQEQNIDSDNRNWSRAQKDQGTINDRDRDQGLIESPINDLGTKIRQ